MTAIIDYGVGNLFSLKSSFLAIGETAAVTTDPAVLTQADRIVLPGVGAFRDAAEKLRASGLVPTLESELSRGKPVLGICLGMQLLFDRSFEYGEHAGLGLLRGEIRSIAEDAPGRKVPHMGWNSLRFRKSNHPLFRYITEGSYVYFVHSFYATDCEESILASAEYGVDIPAAVGRGKLMGCQFHPEKSGEVGLNILRAFCEMGVDTPC